MRLRIQLPAILAGYVMVMAMLASLSGCSTLAKAPATAELATKYAVLRILESADNPVERASRIVDVAEQALELASGEPVLVSAVEAAVREAVHWSSLSPADALLADYLITTVATELTARVGDGNWITGDNLLTARTVLSWVLDTAGGTQ